MILCFACLPTTSLQAATTTSTVIVPGTSMPWDPLVNTAYDFGIHDATPPVIVPLSTSEPVVTITATGRVAASSGFRFNDPGGNVSYPVYHIRGSTGQFFPSACIFSAKPVLLTELVGTFADQHGSIVGIPFAIGAGPTTALTPLGAAQLQLGVNDDRFADNLGSFHVRVTTSDEQKGTNSVVDAAAPEIRVTLSKTWTDVVDGNLIVHAAVSLQAVDMPVRVDASSFVLRVEHPSGRMQAYQSLARAAPTYQKINPLAPSQTIAAFEVNPNEDLGHLGSVVVPTGDAILKTVTFSLGNASIEKSDDLSVVLR